MADLSNPQYKRKIPVEKKEIFGWAMFDFANSSYTTVVLTVIYSAFFIKHIVPQGTELKDTYWAIAMILSMVITMFLAPFIGVLCDNSGNKKGYLFITTLLCSISTAGLFLVGPGDIALAIIIVAISNIGFMLSESFCASFLTDLSTKKNMAWISAIGWGIGYMGGLVSLIIIMQIIKADALTDTALFVRQNQWAMVAIGAFFILTALPTFILVRERSHPAPGFEKLNLPKLFHSGIESLKSSMELAKQNPILLQFLLTFMVYMAGLEAIMKFVGIYATIELKFSSGDLTVMFLILQFSAMGGALSFGWLESHIGPRNTVMATLIWWMVAVLGIFFLNNLSSLISVEPKTLFFVISLIAGAGIGSTQSSSRAVVGLLTPVDQSAKMFGFWGMFSRLAAILGMTFGFMSDALDSRRFALLLVLGFFVVGSIMLSRIPLSEGITKLDEDEKQI